MWANEANYFKPHVYHYDLLILISLINLFLFMVLHNKYE